MSNKVDNYLELDKLPKHILSNSEFQMNSVELVKSFIWGKSGLKRVYRGS